MFFTCISSSKNTVCVQLTVPEVILGTFLAQLIITDLKKKKFGLWRHFTSSDFNKEQSHITRKTFSLLLQGENTIYGTQRLNEISQSNKRFLIARFVKL